MSNMKNPGVRRARGRLEDLVREVCDQITLGAIELPQGQANWTPHRLAGVIKEKYPASGVDPSTGAISDTLKRWRDVGFAVIEDGPLSFVDYTDEGREHGLTELKARHRAANAEARKAQKERETADA